MKSNNNKYIIIEDNSVCNTIGISRYCREERYANFASTSYSLVNLIVASFHSNAKAIMANETMAQSPPGPGGSLDLQLQIRGGLMICNPRWEKDVKWRNDTNPGEARCHHRNIIGGIVPRIPGRGHLLDMSQVEREKRNARGDNSTSKTSQNSDSKQQSKQRGKDSGVPFWKVDGRVVYKKRIASWACWVLVAVEASWTQSELPVWRCSVI